MRVVSLRTYWVQDFIEELLRKLSYSKAPFERGLVENKHSAYQEFVKYYMLLIVFSGD